jgi:hypothetical protein
LNTNPRSFSRRRKFAKQAKFLPAALFWAVAVLTALTTFLSVQTSNVAVQAVSLPDFRIDSYRTDLTIQPDGLVTITETLELFYMSDSEKTRLYLETGNAAQLVVRDVAISAQGKADQAVSMLSISQAGSSGQASGKSLTYTVNESEGSFRLSIRAPAEAGTNRILRLSYDLQGALIRHQDCVVFRRPLLQAAGRLAIRQPIVILNYPDLIRTQDAWFTAVSGEPVLAVAVEAGVAQLSAPTLAAGEKLTAAVVLPVIDDWENLPLAAEPQFRSELVASFEQDAEAARNRARMASLTGILIGSLMMLSLAGLIVSGLVFDREGVLQLRHTLDVPATPDLRPAVLARLIRPRHPGQLVLGTLIDLVRRGKLRLDGHIFSYDEKSLADFHGMVAFEIFLVQWLFEKVTHSQTLSIAQIRQYALDRSTAAEFTAYYGQLIQLIDEDLEQAGLSSPHKRGIGLAIGLAGATVLSLLAVLVSALARTANGLWLLVPASAYFFYGRVARHLPRAGNIQADLGLAYRRSLLSNYQCPLAETVVNHMPYAVSLGISRRYLERLAVCYEKEPERIISVLSCFTGSIPAADPADQLRDFARDLDSMESMLAASLYFAHGIHFHS